MKGMPEDKTYEDIKDVEIFMSGTHNGDKYTDKDLDSMIEAYGKTGFRPPLKDGHHKDEPGMPALGWVENLKRVGNKLVADFVDMPKVVYDAIKRKAYDRVSAEIYWGYKGKDGVLPRVLKAVSLLGADIPAIKELRPLRESLAEDLSVDFKEYELKLNVEAKEEHIYVEGIKFVIGKPKGSTKTEVQTVIFNKKEGWTQDKASSWLKSHGMHSGKVDDTGESLRFRQRDPGDFEPGAFRTIEPGAKKATTVDELLTQITQIYITQEEVKEMEEKMIKELIEKLTAMDEKVNKALAGKDASVTELEGKVKSLTDALSEEKNKVKNYTSEDAGKKVLQLQKELESTQTELQSAVEKFTQAEKKKGDLEESQRKERIERKVQSVKIPVFRPFIQHHYDMATKPEHTTEIVKFSADGSASKDLTHERVVDEMVASINHLADNKYFQELSTVEEYRRDDIPPDDNASVEVERRIEQYCAKHNLDPVRDYDKAMDAVLSGDPKLKEAYAK